ncbi:MAG: hypothetical protein K8S18_14745 [Desulfobacula sp.]|nr:hypothetical protein [Desulfobacula sp.]
MKGHTNIPWCSAEEWNQVVMSIKTIDMRNRDRLQNIYEMAAKIRQKFDEISEPIETLCSLTCVDCEDICCVRATIWFDLKDLLFIYFGLNRFPEAQIVKKKDGNREKACCYFSEKGCTLERVERPFICTWYFCPAQKNYQVLYYQKVKLRIDQTLLEIKDLRNKMEEEFIRISNPNL